MAISVWAGITEFPLPSPSGAPNGYVITTSGNQYILAAGGGGGGTPGGSNGQLQYNNSSSFGGLAGSTINGATYDGLFTRTASALTTAPTNFSGYAEAGCDSCIGDGTTWNSRIYSYAEFNDARVYSTTYLNGGDYTTTSTCSLNMSWDADTNPDVTGYIVVTNVNGTGWIKAVDVGTSTTWNTDNPQWPGDTITDPPTPQTFTAHSYINRVTSDNFYGFYTDQFIHANTLELDNGVGFASGGTGNTVTFPTGVIPYSDGTKFTYDSGVTVLGFSGLNAAYFEASGSALGVSLSAASNGGVLNYGSRQAIYWDDANGIGIFLGNGNIPIYPVTVGYSFGANAAIGTETPPTNNQGLSFTVFGGSSGGGGTNLNGGDVLLKSGTTTGNKSSGIKMFATPAQASGTGVNSIIQVADFQVGTGLKLGVAGTTQGFLGLSGVTSGLVTIQGAAAAGTWTMTVPTTGGTSGYFLQTNGSGVTSWVNSSSTLATADLTGQTAAKTTTTLLTPSATGMYRISIYLQVTTPASVSSVLGGAGGVVITYNDGDGNVAQTDTVALTTTAGAIAISSATNTTATNLTGSLVIYARTGVAIQYAIGYTSTGTAMQYAAHLKIENL